MGKRSNFERIPRDCYDTPLEAVAPLAPHLEYGAQFIEPCAGKGDLVHHLEAFGLSCVHAADIEPRADWIYQDDAFENMGGDSWDLVITNPPWSRPILHGMIERFSEQAPTWLLFDADWMHTRQSAPYMPWCRKIVSVGRVRWIPDSKMTGKDNCAWYLFDQHNYGPTEFVGRG